MNTSNVLRLLSLTLVLLLGGLRSPARAQQFNGTLRGTVQDSTGGVLPGAQVSVVEIATNDSRQLTTDAQGRWVLPNLKPGTYRIVVTLDGFKTAALDQVKLDVGAIREVEVTLEVGAAAETVTVTGAGAAVETTRSTLSHDDREQAHGRSAAERPQSVRAGHARARRACRRRTTAARRRRSAAAATRRARSRSTASRT